jgi:serine/threonine-protein kinase
VTLNTNEAETRDEPPSNAQDPPDETLSPERAAPDRIGRYELRFELASGGMGSVYLARLDGTAGFEKLVALKRIHPHLARERSYVEMFLDEAKIASRITHPNVCSVFDLGEADGEYYIAMEYLVGEPLSRLCMRVSKIKGHRRSPLLPLRMARIIADACEGLHAAHELKTANGDLLHVVHRDVNPRNLFVTYDGAVQVVDFGLASARGRLHHTSTGEMKGSVAYMAPEQVKSGALDRRIDVWGLGVALWEMLAVGRLFKRDSTANTMYALLHDEIPPPSKYRPQVPKELDEIALKALARDPDDRWQTAREMGQALRRFLGTRDELIGPAELSEWMTELFPQGQARKSQLMELARMAHAPVLSIPIANEFDITQVASVSGAVPPIPKRQRSRRTMIGLVGAAVATATVLVVLFGRGDPSAENEQPPVAVAAQEVASAESASPAELEPVAGQVPAQALTPTADPRAEPTQATTPVLAPTPKAEKAASKRRTRPRPRKGTKPGTVNLVTRGGWAEVFKDGKPLGSTPRRLTLPAGRHKLVLKPFGDGAPKKVFVEVEAGRTKQVSIPLN